MLKRHISWATDMAADASRTGGGQLQAWLLFDETYGGDGARQRAQAFIREAGLGEACIRCFPYTEADMVDFAVLSELKSAIPDTQNVRDCFTLPCRKSLAWCYHVEAILLWWIQLAGRPDEPAFVWVIEDDVGFSGDISSFIGAYSDDPCDLLSHGYRRVDPDWVWHDTASPGSQEQHFLLTVARAQLEAVAVTSAS